MAYGYVHSIIAASTSALASTPVVPTSLRAKLHAQVGHHDRAHGRTEAALARYRKAVALDSDSTARVALLRVAASEGDHESFYTYLTPQLRATLPAQKLARMLAQLARRCRADKQLRAATDAFHDAHKVEPTNKKWKTEYLKLRKYAPDWGFHSHDANRAWRLSDYPEASTLGIVAPIRQHVFGWLPDPIKDDRVLFKLNGTVVAEARAVEPVVLPDGRRYLQFSRQLKGLWKYAGEGDTLSIEANGHNLTIINRGETYAFHRKQSRADELLAMLEDGHIFNKYGNVTTSIQDNDEWQNAIFDLYAKLREDLNQEHGLTLVPFYGTMLGAVREQNFIGHDNDFDTIYISSYSEPAEVRQEFKEVCSSLLARGYDLKVKPTHTWVKVPGTPYKLDIFFGWFDGEGRLGISYGFHGTPIQRSQQIFEVRTEKLGRFEIPVPANAEDVLAQLYGPDWRTPDPGFAHHAATRKIDRRYHLTTAEVTELHWNQFYRDHKPDHASRFAGFVADRFGSPGTLVEFGCGGGRDGIYFANRGWRAMCGDRSSEAIASANEVRAASGGLDVSFDVVDVADGRDVQRFLAPLQGSTDPAKPLVVYTRFFLHAIGKPAQDGLLDTITSEIDRDFYLCAEFRTIRDRDLAKAHGTHYRRFIDHEQLAEQLRDRWGFEIEHVEAGQGLSPYDGEDPHLARIIAMHPTRT